MALQEKARREALKPHYTPRQLECLSTIARLHAEGHTVPRVLYGGARGGGKSYLGCRLAVELAERHPGIRGYLCRAEASAFRRTTFVTLTEQVGVLSRAGWSVKSSDQYLIHENGSRLDFGGLAGNDDRARVKSMEITFAFVDEASDVEQESARMLEASCRRQPAFAEESFVLYASNPEACWLQPDFIDAPLPGRAYVPALPTDNPHLDPGYITNLEETYADLPNLLAAFLHGSWDSMSSIDAVFTADLLALGLANTGSDEGQIQWGVDVARFGNDSTVIWERVGTSAARLLNRWKKVDTRATSDRIEAMWRAATRRPRVIAIDDIGVGGAVVDNLKHAGVSGVHGVNVGEAAKDPERYFNRRAELAWALRKHIEAGGALPNDADLRTELAAIRWEPRSGRIAITPKDDIKSRLGRSPDLADALMLAYAPIRLGWTYDEIRRFGGFSEEEWARRHPDL